jgi:hypothetical protein
MKDKKITQRGEEFTTITEADTGTYSRLCIQEKKCKERKNPDNMKYFICCQLRTG